MTLHDVERLTRHWAQQPSLRSLVAAIAVTIGVELPKAPTPPSEYLTYEEAKRLVEVTGGTLDGMAGAISG